MEVRRARVDDAAAIAEVHVRTWQGAYAHVFGEERLAAVTVDRRLPMWREILGGEQQSVFVCEADGRVVGFCGVGAGRDDDADGELYAIYVEPEAWGSGAATALMAAGVEELRAAGSADAILWVLEDNPRARRFYEREGWRSDGARRDGEHLGVRTAEVRYRLDL